MAYVLRSALSCAGPLSAFCSWWSSGARGQHAFAHWLLPFDARRWFGQKWSGCCSWDSQGENEAAFCKAVTRSQLHNQVPGQFASAVDCCHLYISSSSWIAQTCWSMSYWGMVPDARLLPISVSMTVLVPSESMPLHCAMVASCS